MKLKKIALITAVSSCLLAASWLFLREPTLTTDAVGHGEVASLRAALAEWRQAYENSGGHSALLRLPLGYSKVLSHRHSRARGRLELNLADGRLSVHATGLEPGDYDVWLLDNRPAGQSAAPEPGDGLLQVGRFHAADGPARLETRLDAARLQGFTLDAVLVTDAGLAPASGTVIVGSPDLLQKLYFAERPGHTVAVGHLEGRPEASPLAFEFLLPKVARADGAGDLASVLGPLVAEGRRLFHKETFGGNGRTCGTCHREDHNFTIDPDYIKNLPQSDPLFVAENDPALAGLEDSNLLRKHALILTNIDGPGTDVFRSVPHTLALATSITSETIAAGGEFAADEQFANATGWGGDGAPGSGSLREFALGAIPQHMTRRLERRPGVDFRVPTSAELDALQAYLLSLGRDKDYPLWQLRFTDPLVEAGKLLFDTKQNPCSDGKEQTGNPARCSGGATPVLGQTGNCNGCHQNAGARSSTTKANPTRDTGIEQLKITPARLLKPDLSYDHGFGQAASLCGPKADQPCFGDGRFNTPPLIEAADTAPFFHNNAVSTLEEAIAMYNSDAFNNSPGALTSKMADRRVKLDASQVVAIASFLRAINVLENIRQSDRLDRQARALGNDAVAREIARLGYAENQDAIRVLKEGVLGTSWKAAQILERAAEFQRLALNARHRSLRNVFLQTALAKKKEARRLIARCDPNAPVPTTVTLPPAGFAYSCADLDL